MLRPTLVVLVVWGAAVWACWHPRLAPWDDRPDDPIAAAAFRYQQRLSADGTVPPNALVRAGEQRAAMLARQGAIAGAGAGAGGPSVPVWTWRGPGNIGGRIRAIVVHPEQPQIMWIGAASGGIWKTTTGGASWFPLDDYLPSLAVASLAIDPLDPDVLYAGTGEGFFETVEGSSNTAAVRGAGIFRSLDGGTAWAQLPATTGPDWYFVNRLAIDPKDNSIILAATGSGIHRSTDAGATWTLASAGLAYDIRFHPTDSTKLVAGRHDQPPGYSLDGGITWSSATGLSPHRAEVRYAPGNPDIVYASASDGTIKIYRSLDGGQSYALRTIGPGVATYEAYNNVIWVDPLDPDHLVLGSVLLYRSTDGGVTLANRFGDVHPDHHAIVQHPDFDGLTNTTVFFGHDGGIDRTDDVYLTSATSLDNDLGITQFYGGAVGAGGVLIGGTQDNGTIRSEGDAQGWLATAGADGGFCAADPVDPDLLYGEQQRLRIFRTEPGLEGIDFIYQGISDAGGNLTNFIPYFMLDPNDPNRMLAAARRLWRTNDVKAAAPAWEAIKPTIEPAGAASGGADPPGAHFAENSPWNISTIAVAEGDADVIWVGYNNGEVWKTTDGTAGVPDWTRVDHAGRGLPDRWISRIVIDRFDHQRVHVAVMGWESDNLWRSDDGGGTWTDASGDGPEGIPQAPVSALAQHRLQPAWLYAGTDVGLFVSSDAGQTWAAVANGLPAAPVEELLWPDDDTLVAVTHGRGFFEGTVPRPRAGDVDGDGVVGVLDLIEVVLGWGTCPSCLPGGCLPDLNGDCTVNVDDLVTVIEHWTG